MVPPRGKARNHLDNQLYKACLGALREHFGFGKIRVVWKKGEVSQHEGIVLELRRLSVGDNLDYQGLIPEEKKLILNDLGEEGYFILIEESTKAKPRVIIGSFTNKGLFYGIQTLVQLARKDKLDRFVIPNIIIIDRPTLSVRGIATGNRKKEYMEKLACYKINEIQIHGAPGIWKDWDSKVDFKISEEIISMAKWANNIYIDPSVAVWPGGYGRIFTWSSEKDREIILEKLKLYRQAGFKKGLVVCASDYVRVGRGNGIVAREDLDRKMTLSEAHNGLLDYLQKHLNGKNFTLEMFPFYYQGSRELHPVEVNYLQSLSKLPENIEIIYGGRMSAADVRFVADTLGRKVLVRLPTPQTPKEDSRRAPVSGVLASMFEKEAQPKMSGIIFETPADESLLREVADFMWNFGR